MTVNIPVGYGEASIIHSGANGTQPFVVTIGLDLELYPDNYVLAANDVMASYLANFRNVLHNSMAVERVLLAIGQADHTSPTVSSDLPSVHGLRDSSNVPINCAVILNKSTPTLGRKGRGRMFLPGMLTEGDVGLSGGLDNPTIADFNDRASDWLTALQEGDETYPALPPVLLHSDPADDPSVITSLLCAPIVGTLRKRIR